MAQLAALAKSDSENPKDIGGCVGLNGGVGCAQNIISYVSIPFHSCGLAFLLQGHEIFIWDPYLRHVDLQLPYVCLHYLSYITYVTLANNFCLTCGGEVGQISGNRHTEAAPLQPCPLRPGFFSIYQVALMRLVDVQHIATSYGEVAATLSLQCLGHNASGKGRSGSSRCSDTTG